MEKSQSGQVVPRAALFDASGTRFAPPFAELGTQPTPTGTHLRDVPGFFPAG